MNDPAESYFGGATRQLQCFSRVGLTNTGGVDQVKRNGDMSNGFENKSKKQRKENTKVELFHLLLDEIK